MGRGTRKRDKEAPETFLWRFPSPQPQDKVVAREEKSVDFVSPLFPR